MTSNTTDQQTRENELNDLALSLAAILSVNNILVKNEFDGLQQIAFVDQKILDHAGTMAVAIRINKIDHELSTREYMRIAAFTMNIQEYNPNALTNKMFRTFGSCMQWMIKNRPDVADRLLSFNLIYEKAEPIYRFIKSNEFAR